VKSAKLIFNLDESFSEYKNNENNFQYLSGNPISTSENEEDNDPFETEFLNSLLENEENILEVNEENEGELTNESEEDPHNLTENGKSSCF
jgi:phage terminase Nu1 subunit (DNA packaging protein)